MDSSRWLISPLTIYDEYFDKDKSCAKRCFIDNIQNELQTNAPKVPLLNEVSLDSISDGHLVAIHGMVQDMFNSELYMDEFDLPNDPTGSSVSLCFRDFGPKEMEFPEEPRNVKFSERQSFYVVPVPGESAWVQRARCQECQYALPCHSGTKRSTSEQSPVEAKRVKGIGNSETKKPKKQFPLIEEESDESKTGVLVRVYEDLKDSLKINEVVHIYGILEHARLGSAIVHEEHVLDGKGTEPVPRVHALVVHRLKHNNPLLIDLPVSLSSVSSEVKMVRENVVNLLTSCLQGDQSAALYTLFHMISSRLIADSPYPTTLPSLNLICPSYNFDVPPGTSSEPIEPMEVQTEVNLSNELVNRLRGLLSSMVTQLATVEMTLDSLNTGPCLMPIRDSEKGLLNSGRLQVPDGTQILVDETGMTTGQLQTRGLLNLRALTMLATRQRVPYDFQFYTQEWETNARVLIVSSGQSLIKPVLAVPYQPVEDYQAVGAPVISEQQWSDIRKYITLLSQSGSRFSLDSTLQQRINDDFVRWRRDKTTFIEADEFAVMLCLLRLHCLSCGEENATAEHWQTVCDLEQERRVRMKAYKIQPAA